MNHQVCTDGWQLKSIANNNITYGVFQRLFYKKSVIRLDKSVPSLLKLLAF